MPLSRNDWNKFVSLLNDSPHPLLPWVVRKELNPEEARVVIYVTSCARATLHQRWDRSRTFLAGISVPLVWSVESADYTTARGPLCSSAKHSITSKFVVDAICLVLIKKASDLWSSKRPLYRHRLSSITARNCFAGSCLKSSNIVQSAITAYTLLSLWVLSISHISVSYTALLHEIWIFESPLLLL